ncbi:MAG TPA: TonB-dependent receptor plug domain-containing protein [Lacunisphaera sp.]
MKTPTPSSIALLALAVSVSSPAQTQTPAPSSAADPTLVLDPFAVNVERDYGYVAVDSLAGGRQNTPLRITPSAVSALTREFIADTGVTDLESVLRWSLNVVPTNFRSGSAGGTGGDTHNFWSLSIRGDGHVQGGNPPTKNYFPTYMVIDMYNVERVEINSGPNSILFGIGDIGGSLTTYTKQPRFDKDLTEVNLQTTNFGGYRGTLDVNAVKGRFAARVNAVLADQRGWRDGDFDRRKGIDLGVAYKFTERTQLRLDLEGWEQRRNVYASAVQDGLSLWDGTTHAATWGLPVTGAGDNPVTAPGSPGVKYMDAWGGADNYRVYVPGLGMMNWAHGLRSAGTGDFYAGAYLRPDSFTDGRSGRAVPGLPSREFAIASPDSVLEGRSGAASLTFEHRFNDHSELQVQGYRYIDTAKGKNFEGAGGGLGYGAAYDLNQQLPDGQPNPNYGKIYSDQFLDRQTQNHRVTELRAQYTYRFDTTLWNIPLNQSLSLSAGQQVTDYDARQYQLFYRPAYNPATWQQGMVWGRIYWDNPQASWSIPEGGDFFYGPHTYNWFDFNSTQKIKYAGVFSQTRLWNDRLNISLGARRDDYRNTKIGIRGTGNTETIAEDAGNTYSAGVVGYVTEWLGLVANVSSNFQPAAGGLAPSVTGRIFGPSSGKGRDLGVRISTKDHKYYGSVNFYQTKSTDVIGGDSPGFQAIWDQYFKAGGTATDIGPAGIVTGSPGSLKASMTYVDSYDVKYHGVELELVANPTPNIRLQAHYSKPKGEKRNNGPHARVYFAEHLPEWQQAAGPNSPESVLLGTLLSDAQKLLDSTSVPTITPKLPTEIYNFWGTYSFLEGALKGLEIGGGFSYFGQQYGQPWEKVNEERTLSPAYTLVSAFLGYTTDFKAWGRNVRMKFQVNVDNLLDEDKLIYTTFQSYGADGVQGGNYRFLDPRRYTFSANFSF